MESLTGFESVEGRGFYRPSGYMSAGQLADLITVALRAVRAVGFHDVVVNITAITGFESPGPAYRRWVARRWAATVEGTLRVVVVAQPEHICPEKTGLLVAAEEGLDAYICTAETEAIDWLNASAPNHPVQQTGGA
jgi:hypothetical protein